MRKYTATRRLAVLLGGLVLVGAAGFSAAADWPIYRGPNHNGISDETGWFSPGARIRAVWSAKVGTGCSSMAVADGRVYTMGNKANKDTVYCFDAATGRAVWTFSYDSPLDAKLYEGGPNATPTVAGGRVYTLSKRGHVFCLDAARGTKIWSTRLGAKPTTWGLAGSPLVLGNVVYLNAGASGTALDSRTGKVIWSSGPGPGGYSTPVPVQRGGQMVLVLFGEKTVLAVRAADGKKVWEHPWDTRYQVNAADPVLIDAGKRVFVSSGYNEGCALLDVSAASPTEVWRNRNMRNKHTNSVLYQGAIYGFDEATLTCLDLATGEKKWTQSGLGSGSLMLADGKLIILAERGRVIIAEATPQAFRQLASGQATSGRGKCWAVPVLANGRIYARSKTGSLACVTFAAK